MRESEDNGIEERNKGKHQGTFYRKGKENHDRLKTWKKKNKTEKKGNRKIKAKEINDK